MITRNLFALSLAAALVAAAPVAFAEYGHGDGRDYRNDHRDTRHDIRDDRRDHRERAYEHREHERDRIARERRYEYARHDQRIYEHAPRGYAVATPVFVPPPVVYSQPPSSLNIVVPITLP